MIEKQINKIIKNIKKEYFKLCKLKLSNDIMEGELNEDFKVVPKDVFSSNDLLSGYESTGYKLDLTIDIKVPLYNK